MKFDDSKILIGTANKIADKVTLKNVVVLTSFVVKDNWTFYPPDFLGEELVGQMISSLETF